MRKFSMLAARYVRVEKRDPAQMFTSSSACATLLDTFFKMSA